MVRKLLFMEQTRRWPLLAGWPCIQRVYAVGAVLRGPAPSVGTCSQVVGGHSADRVRVRHYPSITGLALYVSYVLGRDLCLAYNLGNSIALLWTHRAAGG
ncbi:hypothetical protein D3C76_1331170 [compost metagenome]